MTDNAGYREGIPNTLAVDYIPFYDSKDPEGSTEQAVSILKGHLSRFPKQYAGMCFELVQGEAGYYPGSKEFFLPLFEILKEHSIAIWADEIQTFGRTSKPFAFQHFELDEFIDVVTIGKLSQICATLFNADYKPQPGLLSQTFTGSTSAIATGQVVMDNLLTGEFFGPEGKIVRCHNKFISHLAALEQEYPDNFVGPFGIGAMIAFTVFKGDKAKSKEFTSKLFDAGVISFLAGSNPVRVRFLMPIAAVTLKDIDNVCKIIRETFQQMIKISN